MTQIGSDESVEPILAILDGEFFVVDDLSVSTRQDKQNIVSTKSITSGATVATETNVSMKTHFTNISLRMEKVHTLWLMTRNQRIRVDNFHISKLGAASMGDSRQLIEGSGAEKAVQSR